jgi:beta-glucanase (GH16 family)/lysophospholipase L1-like esterase
VINGGVYMATITVSSNPSTTGDTLTVNFTTDATNISDILLSKDGGSTYISATSFTNSSAVFNISNWDNGTYNNCKLKCVYTETSSGDSEISTESGTFGALLSSASTWYVIGDSISDTNLLPQTKYMTILGNKFNNLTINNVGKDGSHFTNKTTGYSTFATLLGKLPSSDPSVITIFGGVNDYIQSCTIGDISSTDTNNFYGALNDFVTTLNNKYTNAKKLFIIPLNMRAGVFSTNSNGTNSLGNTLQQYRDAIIAVCKDNNIEYIDLHGDAELQPDLISSDGLHPTQDGHKLLASKLSKCKITSGSVTPPAPSETYTVAESGNFSTVGKCEGVQVDSSGNLVASTLGQWGMVKLDKSLSKLKFTVRDSVADYGALCWYIYNDNGDGTYNMIALGNTSAGENGKRFKMTIPGTGATQIDKLEMNTINPGETLTIEINGNTQTVYRQDGSKLVTLTGNMSGWCGQSSNSSPFCSNIQYISGSSTTETLTISDIGNITQTEQTEFYIQYTTNIAIIKHEVSWDGGSTFYDKTSDVTSSGTTYKFKHDNKASAGTYQMAIRVTTAKGTTKTSNVFTVTLTSTSTPEPTIPTPVYELTADTVFDGSSKCVDTGVKLFKTASDYTLFIDFDDYGASQNSLAHLFHCAYENSDGDGLKVYYNGEDNHYYIIGNRQNTSDGTYESSWTLVGGQNNKIAIAISKGVVSQIVINGSAVAVTKNEYDMNDYSLILGAYQDAQCDKSKYWKGTIHACKVWNSAFTVDEMKKLCNSSSGGGSNPGGSSDGYREGRTLIWEDDFTGTTLNTANWDYENNYSRPNEVQNYVAGTNNVWVENSNLVIKAKKESSNGKEWSSGCIHTDNKREFMYGRFEAKIKIPQTIGSFPAFWTLGGNYEEGGGITWPYCGEIDIMEHKQGYAWTTAGALYRTDLVWDNWDAKDLGRVDSGAIGSFDDYHIYAMEWTHDKLDYYVDDRLIGHSDISDDSTWFMFHQPHYILLNQALGAAGGSVPSDMTEYTMYVDWVRVYAPEAAPSGGGTTNKIWFEDTSARHMDKWSKLGLIPKFNESWTNKVITWKSSNESIATVCGGRVDSKGVDGSCIITATTLEGQSASITVNVGNGQPTTPTTTIGNMTYGKGIDQNTHIIKDDAAYWATVDPVTVEQGATYTLQMDGTWAWGYAFDDNDKYVSELFTSSGNNNTKNTFTAPTTKIRYGCYDPGKYLTYCNLTKTSGESS